MQGGARALKVDVRVRVRATARIGLRAFIPSRPGTHIIWKRSKASFPLKPSLHSAHKG